jgi:hypothetical protein
VATAAAAGGVATAAAGGVATAAVAVEFATGVAEVLPVPVALNCTVPLFPDVLVMESCSIQEFDCSAQIVQTNHAGLSRSLRC